MRTVRTSLIVAIVFAATQGARADLFRGPVASPQAGGSGFVPFTAPALVRGEHGKASARPSGTDSGSDPRSASDSQADWTIDPLSGGVSTEWGSGHSFRPGKQAVQELPPLPGSASLFLTAVLSAGAWHLLRSARHLHLSALPEWYHPGGPTQIGHAVPYDWDAAALPGCFEQPLLEPPSFYRARGEPRVRLDLPHITRIKAPRGPPLDPSL